MRPVMSKVALVIGAGGTDGSYLCDELLSRGYTVYGTVRRSSVDNTVRIRHILSTPEVVNRFHLLRADLCDPWSTATALFSANNASRESGLVVYNMADQDHVGWSEFIPAYNYDVTFGAVGRLLEVILDEFPAVKVFQPVSATMFSTSKDNTTPCYEGRHCDPQSPYAVAKLGAYHLCRYYRQHRGVNVTTGIMFNHDSERRGGDYLLQRIARYAVETKRGLRQAAPLYGLDDVVDIGYAPEFMRGVVDLMESNTPPDDYCIGTGRGVTVQDVWSTAVHAIGLPYTGGLPRNRDCYDYLLSRDAPSVTRGRGCLVADTTKLRGVLGDRWQPHNAEYVVTKLVQHFMRTL